MQGASCFDNTVGLWRAVRADHPDLGLTLPADVFASERVVGPLADDGARLRLCIGAYPAPRTLRPGAGQGEGAGAVPPLGDGARRLRDGRLHDPTIISIAQELARRNDIEPDGYEHQMFYGVRPRSSGGLSTSAIAAAPMCRSAPPGTST